MSSTRSRDRDVSIRLMRQYNYRSEELICNKAMEEDLYTLGANIFLLEINIEDGGRRENQRKPSN